MSQQLRILRDAGLVAERRRGRQRFYRLKPEPLKAVAAWVGEHELFWSRKLDALGEYLRRKHKRRPSSH